MLYLDYAVPHDKLLWTPMIRYDLEYDQNWFDDPEVVRIAEEIDDVKHVWADFFVGTITDRCSGKELSGGAKTVIAVYVGLTRGDVVPLQFLGENCFPVLGSLNIKEDVTFNGDTYPFIKDFGCKFISKRTGKTIDNYLDYREEMDMFATKN